MYAAPQRDRERIDGLATFVAAAFLTALGLVAALARVGAPDRVVAALEGWLIDALHGLGVEGETREDRVGVWVARPDKPPGLDGSPAEDKIAAIGVRVRRWTTFHGVSLNVAPDLSHFSGIVPCGIGEAHYGVTSLADLGRAAAMADADRALRTAFAARFGPTVDV